MIKAKKGKCVIKGTGREVLEDLTGIIQGFYDNTKKEYGEEFAKQLITGLVETCLLSEKELEERAKNHMVNILKSVVGELEREEKADE